ncbi:hypothetical protein HZS_4628 [Henneguya salminicola]|nr:hypothetical protein HZS_4628 [Henneguya salminicola]
MRDIGDRVFVTKFATFNSQLDECIEKYINHYHQSSMEEFKEFFECETWESCPLPDNFNIYEMIEFKFPATNLYSENSKCIHLNVNAPDLQWLPPEVINIYKDLNTNVSVHVCNTFLNLLRLIGRYLKGMRAFEYKWPCSLIFELFNYAFYCLMLSFGDKKLLHIPEYMCHIDPFRLDIFEDIKNVLTNNTPLRNRFHILTVFIHYFDQLSQPPQSESVLMNFPQRIVAIQSLLFCDF